MTALIFLAYMGVYIPTKETQTEQHKAFTFT